MSWNVLVDNKIELVIFLPAVSSAYLYFLQGDQYLFVSLISAVCAGVFYEVVGTVNQSLSDDSQGYNEVGKDVIDTLGFNKTTVAKALVGLFVCLWMIVFPYTTYLLYQVSRTGLEVATLFYLQFIVIVVGVTRYIIIKEEFSIYMEGAMDEVFDGDEEEN